MTISIDQLTADVATLQTTLNTYIASVATPVDLSAVDAAVVAMTAQVTAATPVATPAEQIGTNKA